MSAVTYGHDSVPVGRKVTVQRRGWLTRLMDRIVEVRLHQAAREVEQRLGYLPYSLDRRGDRLVNTGHDDMPFGG